MHTYTDAQVHMFTCSYADGSRAHGPRLRMRLVSASHHMVEAKQAELLSMVRNQTCALM